MTLNPPSPATHPRRTTAPLIALTMGDPAGIGPELCLKTLLATDDLPDCVPVVFGDAELMRRIAGRCAVPLQADVLPLSAWQQGSHPTAPTIVDCGAVNAQDVVPGTVSKACGQAAITYIETAVEAAMSSRVAAVATAPVHKEALHLAGLPYPGHTEFLAALTQANRTCMMLASEEITVSLVTVHTAYRNVMAELTGENILQTIELTYDAMRRLGKETPRLTVCALNPHAGENGLFGNEEAERIMPAVESARARGMQVSDPLPPDTAFIPARRKDTDAYIVMYHDQGLIPFKMLAFEKGVNITLGLPIVRTSVDHGTAFDIAWQGVASPSSMIESLRWAIRLSAK